MCAQETQSFIRALLLITVTACQAVTSVEGRDPDRVRSTPIELPLEQAARVTACPALPGPTVTAQVWHTAASTTGINYSLETLTKITDSSVSHYKGHIFPSHSTSSCTCCIMKREMHPNSPLSGGFEFAFVRTDQWKLPSKVVLISVCTHIIIPELEPVPEIRVKEV